MAHPTPEQLQADCALIEKHGGPADLAAKLGLPEASGYQTVHNWKTRGIPAGWKLRRPDLFLPKGVAKAMAKAGQ
jgi:hypothetical protein